MECQTVVYLEKFNLCIVNSNTEMNCRIEALSQADTEDVKMVEGLVPGIDFCNHGRLIFGILFLDPLLRLLLSSNI